MPVFGETGVSCRAYKYLGSFRITISGESTKDFELFSAYVTEGSTNNEVAFTKTVDSQALRVKRMFGRPPVDIQKARVSTKAD